MPRRSNSPQRTCLGCRNRDAKSQMIRIATQRGVVNIDNAGSAPGRGGYLHLRSTCLEKFAATKVKKFRSLNAAVDRTERLRILEGLKASIVLDSDKRLE